MEGKKSPTDRAAALVDPASLASSVYNVRKPFTAEAEVAAGGVLTLPGYYFPTRDVLFLGYDGTICTPRKVGVEMAGEYQYEEIGTDPNVASNQIRVFFGVAEGDVLDMWVVASAAGRNIEELEALVGQAAGYRNEAAESARQAAKEVGNAAAQVVLAEGEADRSKEEANRAARLVAQLPDVSIALDGQVLVAREVGGVMHADYENAPSAAVARRDEVLAGEIAAGAQYQVPLYIVGSCKLQIYFDGALCVQGLDGTYTEDGVVGEQSTSITFNIDIAAGTDLTVIAAS